MSWTKNITTVLVSILISLILAEIIFRIFEIGYGHAPLERSKVYHHVQPSNYEFLMHDPNGEFGGHKVFYDEARFRVPNRESSTIKFIDNENTIIFLGDSVTEGNQVPYKDTFVSLVGKQLGKNVVNLGTSSYSPIIFQLLTKNIISNFKADTVIMQIHSGDFRNDSNYMKDTVMINNEIVAINGGENNAMISLLRKSYLMRFIRKNQLVLKELINSRNKTVPRIKNTEQRVTYDQMINTVNIISKINQDLSKQGKSLYVFLLPNKSLTKKKSCCVTDSLYSKFYHALAEKDITTINVAEEFENSLIQENLFYEIDIHLTLEGHKVLADAIAKRLK